VRKLSEILEIEISMSEIEELARRSDLRFHRMKKRLQQYVRPSMKKVGWEQYIA
jgi:proteasome assembly chaperone (PAC2) family protein